MDVTGTQELLIQSMEIGLSALAIIIGYYVKNFVKDKAIAEKLGMDRTELNAKIDDAINYAEEASRRTFIESVKKKDIANQYLDKVHPELYKEYGDKLEMIIDKRVGETFNIDKPTVKKEETK